MRIFHAGNVMTLMFLFILCVAEAQQKNSPNKTTVTTGVVKRVTVSQGKPKEKVFYEKEYREREAREKYLKTKETKGKGLRREEEENDEYDGAGEAAEFEFEKTKDPALNRVPRERLLNALEQAKYSRKNYQRPNPPVQTGGTKGNGSGQISADAAGQLSTTTQTTTGTTANSTTATTSVASDMIWTERGPYADVVGPSNGNTRANSAITAGRTRAILVDAGDVTNKTVWVAGVDGGLWKTTDITASPTPWVLVNDFLINLAVSDIVQDPRNPDVMYFSTGEPTTNADRVLGVGVFKSTDHGVTWTHLTNTMNYNQCFRLLCDYQGNLYLATRSNGLLRSVDGGTTWTTITPTNMGSLISDIELSTTTGAARLHVASGGSATQTDSYRYTDNPATVTSSSGWITATTPYIYNGYRVELACSGNVLIALPADPNTKNVTTIFKSTDGGDNWTATTGQPASGWANTQAWYSLAAAINPSNTDQFIVGGLDCHKTTDGGATWTKISSWYGTSGQYVHADIHEIIWYESGNKLLIGCDGGIHYSADAGTTIRDRNSGYRIKQFYSCAIHPTSTNYILAGAQDNGTHQLNGAGLTTSVEVTGGDGAFVAIDQDQPAYQYGAYVYSTYRISKNSGSGWSSYNFYKGTSSAASNFGRFINPFTYDNTENILYAASSSGELFRWTTTQTTSSGSYYQGSNFPTGAEIITVSNLSGYQVSSLKVSPYTSKRLYVGTGAGRIIYLDNANIETSATAAGVIINNSGMPGGYVSAIEVGSSDQYLIACFSNYGVSNVWVSTNGGTSWTAIDGNLPDMPVRWCMFYPGDNTKAIIATEAGVWATDLINGSSTVWNASPTFPTVRTDMLQYRASDGTLVAATHGRGVFTTILANCTGTPATSNINALADYLCSGTGTTLSLSTGYGGMGFSFQWSYSTTPGGTYTPAGNAVTENTGNLTEDRYYICTIKCMASGQTVTTPEKLIKVYASLPAPTGTNASKCGSGTLTIGATPPAGASVAWYAGDATTTVLGTSNSYTTPTLSTTTTYYAESVLGTSCKSTTRTPVTATINTVPAAPTGSPASRCGTGTLAISASAPTGFVVDWYSASTGGTLLASNSNSYTTPSISASTTYYAVSRDANTNCISTTRTAVAATVNAIPTAPTTTGFTRCGSGTVTLTSTPPAGSTSDWYDAASGGNVLASGVNSYSPSITQTTTYYVASRNSTTGCTSTTRTSVTATIATAPVAPTGTNGSRCGSGTVVISATPPSGATIAWFTTSTSTTALATTNSYTTPSITAPSTTTYYAESRIGSCASTSRTAVTATAAATPTAPTGTSGSRCGTGAVTISATPPSGSTIAWYATNTSTTVLATTNSFTTPSISATTTYYAASRTTTGNCSSSRTAVTATVNALPATPSAIKGTLTNCPNTTSSYAYSISTVRGAASYKWTIPSCATSAGSTTTSISLQFPTGIASAANISVQTVGTNGCLSNASTAKITSATGCSGCSALAGEANPGFNVMMPENNFDVRVFPNPSNASFNLELNSLGNELIKIQVMDLQGRLLQMVESNSKTVMKVGEDLKPGLYIFSVEQGMNRKSIKVIKL